MTHEQLSANDPLFRVPRVFLDVRRRTPPAPSLAPISEQGNGAANPHGRNPLGGHPLPISRGPPPVTNLAFQGRPRPADDNGSPPTSMRDALRRGLWRFPFRRPG
ncbi:hypothetical protein MTO96_035030 [Rhipicephalus appendiculatus]